LILCYHHPQPANMSTTRSKVPIPKNEPILGYAKGSPERSAIEAKIAEFRSKVIEIPCIINGKDVKTGKTYDAVIPHEHKHVLAKVHMASEQNIKDAIAGAMEARKKYAKMPVDARLSIFLKAAELLAGPYRQIMNAATCLNQGKNFFQAEIDSACELIDFLRFNAHYAMQIYDEQPPENSKAVWNRTTWRPLEGFVYAITPFNFTAIGGNLPTSPALMGNVVIWKPARYATLACYYFMRLLKEAGLPDGVIQFLPGDPDMITKMCLGSPDFGGIHYTGSTGVFKDIWRMVGQHIDVYKSYPRIVGETGGKDFTVMHESADVKETVCALIRGAFEYAGQKCSACSRCYIPKSRWAEVKAEFLEQMKHVKMGSPEDPTVLVNSVIHKKSFDNAKSYIEWAKAQKDCEIVYGGKCDDSVGYFIEPTFILCQDPKCKVMAEEIFAPILSCYVYDMPWEKLLQLVDETGPFSLTGCVFSGDRYAIAVAEDMLEDASGNFYINDKCTGAVVGQQPFGGARASGTNDKAGSKLNLLRWVSCHAIKENFLPPTFPLYPYMTEKQ